MNSRELRSLEEALAPFAEMFSRTEEEVRRLQAIHPDHDYQFAGHRWREVLAGSVVPTAFRDAHSLLSSRTEGPAPPPTPKGLERWREILGPPDYEYRDGRGALWTEPKILSAIRRSVEEALVAAASPLEEDWQPIETAPKGRAVLVWKSNTQEQYTASYITGAHGPGWCSQDGCELFKVSHWRPLPKPPKEVAPNV